jgi:hypothetical protein
MRRWFLFAAAAALWTTLLFAPLFRDSLRADSVKPQEERQKRAATTLRFEVTVPPRGMDEAARVERLLLVLGRPGGGEPRLAAGQSGLRVAPTLGVDVTRGEMATTAILDARAAIAPLASLADLPAGKYAVQAVLRTNRDLCLTNAPGNYYSKPLVVHLDPAKGETIKLTLTERLPDEKMPADTENVKFLKFHSKALSDFHSRPMYLRAGVVLPRDFAKEADRKYPLRVHIGGYGTRFTAARRMATATWLAKDAPRMLMLVLDGAGPLGDPYQVNSANHGPYGDALVKELIPHVEKQFRGIGQPHARVLDGVSTGGWVSLALQIFYPDFFNGCWSSCPDPVDFRAYEVINIYTDDNAYVNRHGFERPAMRDLYGDVAYTIRSEVYMENVLGLGDNWAHASGKDWCAWNAVYAPRGKDGLPQPLWDPKTGKIDRTVAEHYRKYDLADLLDRNWEALAPKLKGKIRVQVGDADQYFLNNAVRLFEERIQARNNAPLEAWVQIHPAKGHIGFWSERELLAEMAKAIEKGRPR